MRLKMNYLRLNFRHGIPESDAAHPTSKINCSIHEIQTDSFEFSLVILVANPVYSSDSSVHDLRSGPVFTNRSQEQSLSFCPRFANYNVTQLLIG